jgi:nicotinate phosphoribosyltransferase
MRNVKFIPLTVKKLQKEGKMECVKHRSLADNDLYKYTMGQAVYHQYPGAIVRYKFKCRNNDESIGKDPAKLLLLCDMLRESVSILCDLQHTYEELSYLSSIRYIKPDFIDFLRLLKLNKNHFECWVHNGELIINIEGPWLYTIWFEVPILSIISETYTLLYGDQKTFWPGTIIPWPETRDRAVEKFNYLKHRVDYPDRDKFKFTDFSTRRRASYDAQGFMIETAMSMVPEMFAGTSNVHFAMKYDIPVFGTMAHEWVCAHQQLGGKVVNSQKDAFTAWLKEYQGDLGIALSDTVGFDAFLKDFDLLFSKVFDGIRQDSGDAHEQCIKLIKHYENLKIDPKSKSIVFSNGLNFVEAIDLFYQFLGSIKTGFGIGTNFGNDNGLTPPQIVIKMVECNGGPVAKVSNDPGKAMCEDVEHENWVKHVFHI